MRSYIQSVKIPLNPAFSPQANAAKYFKDYKIKEKLYQKGLSYEKDY